MMKGIVFGSLLALALLALPRDTPATSSVLMSADIYPGLTHAGVDAVTGESLTAVFMGNTWVNEKTGRTLYVCENGANGHACFEEAPPCPLYVSTYYHVRSGIFMENHDTLWCAE